MEEERKRNKRIIKSLNDLAFGQPINTPQLAEYFQVDDRTVANWRKKKIIPFWRIGKRCIRYRLPDVIAALQK